MTEFDRQQQLAELLRRTWTAHHQAFFDVDGDDPDWPLWYAHHIRDEMNQMMESDRTVSELTYLFVAAEKARQSLEPTGDWAQFYSQYLLAEYGL